MLKKIILCSLLPLFFCSYAVAAQEYEGMRVNGQSATAAEAMRALMWKGPASRGFNSKAKQFPHWRAYTISKPASLPLPENLDQYVYQKQTAELHKKSHKDVDIQIHFATNDAQLTREAKEILRNNADILKLGSTEVLHLTGHADSRGSPSYNLVLSNRRAQSVADFLEAVHPDLDGHLFVLGMGQMQPIFDASGHEDFARSRRVQFDIFSH